MFEDDDEYIDHTADDIIADSIQKDDTNQSRFDDDDSTSYGRKVEKRINREVSKRKQLEEQLNHERSQREQLEARLGNIEKSQPSQVDNDIVDLNRKKAELLELGEYVQVAEIDDQIIDLKIKKKSETQQQVKEPAPKVITSPDAEIEWMAKNDWYHNPANQAQRDKTHQIYRDIQAEGFDPEDDDFYSELDKRLGAGSKSVSKPTRERAPSPAPVQRGNDSTPPDAVRITNADARNMRGFGLDPNDPKARKFYMAEKAKG